MIAAVGQFIAAPLGVVFDELFCFGLFILSVFVNDCLNPSEFVAEALVLFLGFEAGEGGEVAVAVAGGHGVAVEGLVDVDVRGAELMGELFLVQTFLGQQGLDLGGVVDIWFHGSGVILFLYCIPSVEELCALLFTECTYHGFQFLFVETFAAIGMGWDVGVDNRPERHRLLAADDALAIGCLSHDTRG